MKKKLKDIFYTGDLAVLLGILEPDDFEERVQEYYSTYSTAESEGTEEEREQQALQAETDYLSEEYRKYANAVSSVADEVFGEHGLVLVERGKGGFKVAPETSWNDAAYKIRDTINGVGSFYFSTLREFLDSGPYTARQAVLSHLHWMASRSDVYGTTSPQRLFESQMR